MTASTVYVTVIGWIDCILTRTPGRGINSFLHVYFEDLKVLMECKCELRKVSSGMKGSCKYVE